jgi:outer membrane receptor protein involved in Fe transport
VLPIYKFVLLVKRVLLLAVVLTFSILNVFPQSLQDTLEIEEVVVTGTKIGVARKNIPLTVSQVPREILEQTTESALLPVISEEVPGLFITERGITGFGVATGAAGQLNIRGLGGNPTTQVLILLDGHPQFMGLMGHHLPDAYVSSDVERVEVIRGPASFLYGTNAFGGVINIITRKQEQDGIEANAILQYGSFNTQKYMGSIGYKKKKFNVFASINHDQTDGHRDTSDFRITNGYVKAGYHFNDQFNLFVDFNLAGYETADPGMTGAPAGERIDILRGKTSLSLENKMEKLEGALKLYYNFGDHDISDGWHSIDRMMGVMVYQGMKLLPGNSFTLGLDYMNYGGQGSPITTVLRNEDGTVIMPPTFQLSPYNDTWIDMSNTGLYATVRQELWKQLILNGGLRYEMNSTYRNEWIPYFGISWNPKPSTNLKAIISDGYRAPSLRELYLFPPANDNLMPERMVSYELGWRQYWMKGSIKTELNTFICDGQNLIVLVPPAAPPPPQYKNSGEFNNKGIEFMINYRSRNGLALNANYTYIYMKNPLPGTPGHNLFTSSTYHYKKWQFRVKLQSIFDLYNETGQGVEVVEKDYQLLGIQVGYQITSFLNLYLAGNNLLDQTYQINYGYPMPGINFMGGVRLKFVNYK